jgi:hypothetical protein
MQWPITTSGTDGRHDGMERVGGQTGQCLLVALIADRAKAGILVGNYGESSAVNLYRPVVPMAISGNQNYWYWATHGHDGSVKVVFGETRERRWNSNLTA